MSSTAEDLSYLHLNPQESDTGEQDQENVVSLFLHTSTPLTPEEQAAEYQQTMAAEAEREAEYHRRYDVTDEFIDTKAPEFYGTKLLPASPPYRLTMIRKALMRIPDLDAPTTAWVEAHEDKKTLQKITRLGETALHTVIAIPERSTAPDADEPRWTQRELEAFRAFRNPRIREAVLTELALHNDPTAHVIMRLERWRMSQKDPVKDVEITGSQRAFEQVLFTIHSGTLPQFIQTIAGLRRTEFGL
jgi:hypothetical protein